jgi:hypothetical protein
MATNQPGMHEVVRHEQTVDRISEQNQRLNLAENKRAVDAANQNSSIARVVNVVYYLFGIVEVVLMIRILLHLVADNSGNAFANIMDALAGVRCASLLGGSSCHGGRSTNRQSYYSTGTKR